MTALKVSITAKDAEIEDNKTKVLQLRKLGRKYKQQADDTQKELEEAKTQKDNAVTQKDNATVSLSTKIDAK